MMSTEKILALNYFTKQFVLCFVAMIFYNNCFSQNVLPAPTAHFESLGPAQGLSCNWVMSIAQDKQGFIWLATDAGLYRYDGYNFELYNSKKNYNAYNDEECNTLFSANNGLLWIGGKYLNVYDSHTETFRQFHLTGDAKKNKFEMTLSCITGDDKENIWLCMNGVGVIQFNIKEEKIKSIIEIRNVTAIKDEIYTSLCIDKNGWLYIGTQSDGLFALNGSTKQFYSLSDSINKKSCHKLYGPFSSIVSKENILWIGNKTGLTSYNILTRSCTDYPYKPEHKIVTEPENRSSIFFEDDKGKIWLLVENYGLNILDPASGIYYSYFNKMSEPGSIESQEIICALMDNSGKKWIGFYGGTVNTLDPPTKNFITYKHDGANPKTVSATRIFSIYKDHKNVIWVGTERGLNIFNKSEKTFSVYHHPSDKKIFLSECWVMSLCQDHQNNFYFGTDGGYVIFNPSTNLFKYVNEGVNTPGIYCDKKNNMWFGFWGGGMKMIATDGTKKYYRHNETDSLSNPDEFCAAFGEDDSGRIIFLTYKNGVELFNPGTEKFTVFVHDKNNPASISHNTTGGYCKSRNGVEWFPTVGSGLNEIGRAHV